MTLDNCVKLIRDILREDGITGMDSICHCIAFIILRSLTPAKCNELDIPVKYAFVNIDKDSDNTLLDSECLYDKVFSSKKGVDSFIRQLRITIKYTTFKWKLKSPDKLNDIIKLMKEIDYENISTNTDIIGTIYELHLKTGSSGGGMRDLGQYFTHRLIIKYMVEMCHPKMIGNSIEKIVDPSMGTGGFITMAAKYYNEKYPDIDWKLNKKRISGFDIDESVMEMARLNLYLETGEHFNNTLVQRDTLYKDMVLPNNVAPLSADIILANEPMGITNIIHANCCDRVKNLKIRGTSAEPLFLQLFMEALNKNGRCAVVVPEGVLFKDTILHIGTREKLVENYNLLKVISLKGNKVFLSTSAQTYILYFENNGKTTKTQFSSLSLENDKLKEEIIMDVDYSTLVKNKYSLLVNKYKTDNHSIEGANYKKLKDIINIKPKGHRNSKKDGLTKGTYPLYFCSILKHLYMDTYDFNDEGIMINTTNGSGKCRLFYCRSKYSVADSVLRFASNNDNILTKYIFNYLSLPDTIDKIQSLYKGTNQKSLSRPDFLNLEIPIPSLEIQKSIIENIDTLRNVNAELEENIKNNNIIMNAILVDTLTQHSMDTPVETPIVTEEITESVSTEQSLEEFTGKLNNLTNPQLNEVLQNNNLRGKTKNKPIKKQMIIDARTSKNIVL